MKKKFCSLGLTMLLTLSLCVPALAAELDNVTDAVGIMTEETWQELNELASDISYDYGCGVYAAVVDDYTDYGDGDISDVAGQIYQTYDYGVGEQWNGILLLLSLDDRDYSLYVFGETAKTAFGSYARDQLAEEFLDDFANDDWEGGIYDYIVTCGSYLDSAANGEPVKESPLVGIAIGVGAGCFLAMAVCLILKRKMKSVHKGVSAGAYVTAEGLELTDSYDRYTHTTETRRTIEKKSDSDSFGGSSTSGKF